MYSQMMHNSSEREMNSELKKNERKIGTYLGEKFAQFMTF